MNTDCWPRIRDWRKQQRAALIARRTALPPDRLRQWNVAIGELITSGFPLLAAMTIAFCWPFKSEFDARFVIRRFRERGATAALPAVVAKASPLRFRTWWPGAPAIGVGFELARLPTIQPQPHDIAMDFVVTEAGLHAVGGSHLVRIDTEECRARAQRLCDERGLPRPQQRENFCYSSPPCYAGEFPGDFGKAEEKKS